MGVYRSLVIIAASSFVLLSPIHASAQCALFDSPRRCAQDKLETEMIMEEARRAGQIRAETINAIVAARAQFWATYPDKPGADKARHDFAYWLWVKDFHYLRQNLQAPVQKDQRTQRQTSTDTANALDLLFGGGVLIDDGIRQSARPEFEEWVNAVRKKLFERLPKNSTDAAFMQGILSTWIGDDFWNALGSAKKEYEAYLLARDLWEFDHVNRTPAGYDTPATYGIYLYTRWDNRTPAEAMANYKKMSELLGVQRVEAAAKRVMDAPKAGDGTLVVTVSPFKKGPGGDNVVDYEKPIPEGVIGVYSDPLTAMEVLATQDDDRRYLLFMLQRHVPDRRKVDAANKWTFADTAYKQLVLAFGEQQVLAAARAVRLAPKRLSSGGVMTVKELGVKRTEPIETFEDLLALKDSRASEKLAFLDGETTAPRTAPTVASKTGAPAPATSPGTGPQIDSPQYLAWKRFTPGARATYIDRGIGQRMVGGPLAPGAPGIRSRWLMRSITPERVDLYLTEIAYDPPPASTAHPPHDTEFAYPSQVDGASSARTAAVRGTPIQSGNETLTVAGKTIATRWQSLQAPVARPDCGPAITTTWTSDEVPGGLVREVRDETCRDPRTNVNGAILRSIREKLLESFQTSGPVDGVQPIQPVPGIAAVLPLPVPATLPGQDRSAVPAPAQPAPVDKRVFDRNMGVAPAAPASAPASAPRTAPPIATSGTAVPDSTTITVTMSGWLNSSTNHLGDTATATVVQPVVVNGAPLIPVGSLATVQLAQASDGLTVKLVGVNIGRQGAVAVSSSQVAADGQNAASDAALQQAIAAAGPNGAALQQALAARQVVVSGARVNVPPGTRLTFTLAAPIAIGSAAPAATPPAVVPTAPVRPAPGRRR
ncbi:MAG TPA: hypothetical protein VH436_22615 [Vicinamibacterales bacterium]